MTVLVGGVGELWQGDLDLGRRAAEILSGEDLGPQVVVEELHYGAVAVAQRLEELAPEALVLVTAFARGRVPGTVERRRVASSPPAPAHVQLAVSHAVTGYVDVELVLVVAAGFGVLPTRTVVIEVEPERTDLETELSGTAESALARALELVRAEVRRLPVLQLADDLRGLGCDDHDDAPASQTLAGLLEALDLLDREGRWGSAFALRDRLRLQISDGATSEAMTRTDWALWWALIEELDRIEATEALSP